ncbi:carbamoyltransferase family protein [Spongiimicrobium salis]|uniref:carbamoyltransferase family protein n=1 Tax=Spongiimicrobium salis TaxID=1667022 RepID=UPI00374CC009
MNILGINGGPNHIENEFLKEIIHGQLHDSSVAFLKDGNLIFALEEERATRIKHTNYFPKMALEKCMAYNAVSYDDIDYFAFPISLETLEGYAKEFMEEPLPPHAGLFVLREIFKSHTNYEMDFDKIKLYDHHYCHAISAFCQSGFKESLVVTLDGAGNGLSGTIYKGENGRLSLLKDFPVKKSLGYFYLDITEFLGMEIFDEYKVMGLAPYGDAAEHSELFESFYTLLPNGDYEINSSELYLLHTICPKRKKGDPFDQNHKNIAAALQASLEKIIFHIIAPLQKSTGLKKICLAGGVALNCKMEGELLYSDLFEEVFVYPASGDNGLSAGAAFACQIETKNNFINNKITSTSLGLDFDLKEIETELEKWKDLVEIERSDNIYNDAGNLLAKGEVLGWFKGREEYGPRALGNRSIVADPRPAENKERINSIIKMREGFRPFAPAILEEFVDKYFEIPANGQRSFPFMTFILNAQEKYKQDLGAVVHTDGTSRVQTVSKEHNTIFWKLINSFYEKTNTPVLLNTSFNNNFEPIVHTPANAISFLLTCDVNSIVLENYIVHKKVLNEDKPIYLNSSFYDFVSLSDGFKDTSGFFLHNSYLKKNIQISKALWEFLKSGEPINFSGDSPLLAEFKDIWRQRLIMVEPCLAMV